MPKFNQYLESKIPNIYQKYNEVNDHRPYYRYDISPVDGGIVCLDLYNVTAQNIQSIIDESFSIDSKKMMTYAAVIEFYEFLLNNDNNILFNCRINVNTDINNETNYNIVFLKCINHHLIQVYQNFTTEQHVSILVGYNKNKIIKKETDNHNDGYEWILNYFNKEVNKIFDFSTINNKNFKSVQSLIHMIKL